MKNKREKFFFQNIHNNTKRNYLKRMMNNKIKNSLIAKNTINFIGMVKEIMVMVVIDILMVTGHLLQRSS